MAEWASLDWAQKVRSRDETNQQIQRLGKMDLEKLKGFVLKRVSTLANCMHCKFVKCNAFYFINKSKF